MNWKFWQRRKPATVAVEPDPLRAPSATVNDFFAADDVDDSRRESRGGRMLAILQSLAQTQARSTGAALDAMDDSSGDNTIKRAYGLGQPQMSDVLLQWYLSQGFIGHQIAAYLAQHWLIFKCCNMPARDAVRQGYTVVSDDGGELSPDVSKMMKKADKRYRVNKQMIEFITKGRIFGIRIAIFKIKHTDPKFYEYPFNPDGITAGSYEGIVQVDPYWCAPVLEGASASDPASPNFYEPTHWMINGIKYHRSHLVVFRHGELADILKPVYLYGGIPVPQLIMERVYGAERTANEAPQLAMTKRTTVIGTDIAKAFANREKFDARLALWAEYRDNYGVKIQDKIGDEFQQFDTSLTDLDSVIMTQYQIVAAAADVPATKLLGTTPKGFNSSGEYEESSYHETLESLQTGDLSPFLERHHQCVMRSIIAPKIGKVIATTAVWNPLDSPTALEESTIEKNKADRDKILVDAGAIDGTDIRTRLRSDKQSPYHGIEEGERAPVPGDPGMNVPGAIPVPPTDGATDSALDPVRLITNQKFLSDDIVAVKQALRDFTVQVSPLFIDAEGRRCRIVIDGHHSLEAAKRAGEPPVYVEGDFGGSDYEAVAHA